MRNSQSKIQAALSKKERHTFVARITWFNCGTSQCQKKLANLEQKRRYMTLKRNYGLRRRLLDTSEESAKTQKTLLAGKLESRAKSMRVCFTVTCP